ncbi:MAG: hypothetical protein R3C05_17370 [Pirellulaceae bacterium]
MTRVKLTEKHKHKLPMGLLGGLLLPDDKTIVAACMDGVYRTTIDRSIPPERLYGHESYARSVALVDDTTIVSTGYDGHACWFDLAEKRELRRDRLHHFWSWDMAISPDRTCFASVTGQYLAGGYKYEPQPESEPSIRVVDARTGEIRLSLPHVPSVQAVCFSPDNQFVAAGNLMGEVRVYRVADGELEASFTTPDFTSWGVIKSHCYLGGIFAMAFTPDGNDIMLVGMGPMADPMAGNGKQLWQRWSWREPTPRLVDQSHEGEAGEGLMETIAIDQSGEFFVMGGRLRGGEWNVAAFELKSGKQLANLKTNCRITKALFTTDGEHLVLLGTQGQPKDKHDGKFPDFGRVDVYEVKA